MVFLLVLLLLLLMVMVVVFDQYTERFMKLDTGVEANIHDFQVLIL